MTARENEAAILQMMEPIIRRHCKWKWTAIEIEDRISEAVYVFLIVLRTKSIPEEQIWPVYLRTLQKHMRPINALEGWHRYHCRSSDARIRLSNGEEGSFLHELLPAAQPDICAIVAEIIDASNS